MECEQFDKIVNETRVLMAYIGESDTALFSEAFLPYSKEQDKILFIHLEEPCKESIIAPNLVVYRNFDKRESYYGGKANKESLKVFTVPLLTPVLLEFGDDAIDAIFIQKRPALILYTEDKESEVFKTFEVASKKSPILCVYTDGKSKKLN
jgi:hypothetical protein